MFVPLQPSLVHILQASQPLREVFLRLHEGPACNIATPVNSKTWVAASAEMFIENQVALTVRAFFGPVVKVRAATFSEGKEYPGYCSGSVRLNKPSREYSSIISFCVTHTTSLHGVSVAGI